MQFFRSCIAGLVMAAGFAGIALASDYPARPITIIVPFSAGGGTDITTRTFAGPLAEALGAKVVVKNTAGAGGTIGAAETARAKSDGHTLGMIPVGPMTTQPHLRELPYNPGNFDYICQVYSAPSSLVVSKNSRFSSLQGLLDHAKANPNELNYGVQAVGSIPHIAGLALAAASGANFTFIPYKGSAPTFKAMLDGSVDMFVAHISFLTRNNDQVRSLAMLTSERVSTADDLPTASEQGVPMHFPIWGGLVAPKGIPDEAKSALQAACKTAMNSAVFAERMADLRMPVAFMDGAAFEAFVASEFSRNGDLLTSAGLKK